MSKYCNKKSTGTDENGNEIKFDSNLEKRFFEEIVLKLLEEHKIEKYELQKEYVLLPSFKYQDKTVRKLSYIADFVLYFKERIVVIDTKGLPTADAKLKKKLMHYFYNDLEFYWVGYTKMDGWLEHSELTKKRKQRKEENKGI